MIGPGPSQESHLGSTDPFSSQEGVFGWIQEVAPHGVFTTDADLVVRSWNQWLAVHSGRSTESVVGRKLLDVFPELAQRKLDECYRRALLGEVSVLSSALHKYLLAFAPAVRTFNAPFMLQTARIAPLPAGGEIVGTVTIVEDVTQRVYQERIVRRQQKHDRLLSDALALLLQTALPKEIPAQLFPRITGVLKLDVYWTHLVMPDTGDLELQSSGGLAPGAAESMKRIAMGETWCGQVAAERRPFVESRVQQNDSADAQPVRRLGLSCFAGFPLLVGDRLLGTLAFGSYARESIPADEVDILSQLALYVAIALDRAQREHDLNEAQDNLREHAGDLEEKISARTAKLSETIAQLESFSYTIAHDLRGPVRSLIGFTDVLLSDYSTAVPDSARALLQRLHRASHRLDALTRDLLKFSQLVQQDVQLEPVNLMEILEDIVSVTPAIQGQVLKITPPLGPVLAQRTLLQQCLSNLLDNAVKFMPPGRTPSITIRTEDRLQATPSPQSSVTSPFIPPASGNALLTGPCRRIWIEDNGIGIAPRSQQKIFGIFERVPGPVAVEGTGIGLAIVARAVGQMGGSCGVDSTPDSGSQFWLEFKIPGAPAPAAPDADATS